MKKDEILQNYNRLIIRPNEQLRDYNGIFNRYRYPVLTAEHIPLDWRFDFDEQTNPLFLERLAVNAVFNAGAIYMDGKYCVVARVEGADRKSFFAVARSTSGTDNFVFDEYPVRFDRIGNETNLYDMRLTKHEDGYIYGLFCSESLDEERSGFEAKAECGIVRTKDLVHFERLPNLKTKSPQQRNCVLHPEFVNGKYLVYTRPQDGFIEVGSAGGISYGYTDSMTNAVIEQEYLLAERKYHTVYETKNGAGCVPIKTERGWIHIAHGVRNTAAGLRYVLYAFATAIDEPTKVIACPSGYLIAPQGEERVGDVSNVVFANGAIEHDGVLYVYYASSDTRLHVATFERERLIDYIFNTPQEKFNTYDSVTQRIELIRKNKKIMTEGGKK